MATTATSRFWRRKKTYHYTDLGDSGWFGTPNSMQVKSSQHNIFSPDGLTQQLLYLYWHFPLLLGHLYFIYLTSSNNIIRLRIYIFTCRIVVITILRKYWKIIESCWPENAKILKYCLIAGMAAFLDCLQQFKEEVERGDSGFCLPYEMEKVRHASHVWRCAKLRKNITNSCLQVVSIKNFHW